MRSLLKKHRVSIPFKRERTLQVVGVDNISRLVIVSIPFKRERTLQVKSKRLQNGRGIRSFYSLQTGKDIASYVFNQSHIENFARFYSLQTGKDIARLLDQAAKKINELVFLFPSNGKGHCKSFASFLWLESVQFLFPSNGKGHCKDTDKDADTDEKSFYSLQTGKDIASHPDDTQKPNSRNSCFYSLQTGKDIARRVM